MSESLSADIVRGFPPFPPSTRTGRKFARSWWGRAWIDAVEDLALNSASLATGRRFARRAHVGSITVSPGRLAASVHEDQGEQEHAIVRIDQLTDDQWDRFLDQVAVTAGHIAALLDRDMPQDLVESADSAGVPLLPGFGDLAPECTCPDWGHPCKHAAALSYQTAWLLDDDPFLLLLLRGRGESELIEQLRRRNAAAAGTVEPTDAGDDPAEAYAARIPALPAEPEPSTSDPSPTELPDGPGVGASTLAVLVRDAAARSAELLTGRERTLTAEQDAVRLAATYPEAEERLRDKPGFQRSLAAWRLGGPGFLEVLGEAWTPPRNELVRANAELAGDDGTEQPRIWRNRWTRGDIQLRLGRDGRWYPLRRKGDDWWPAAVPARDAAAALLAAG